VNIVKLGRNLGAVPVDYACHGLLADLAETLVLMPIDSSCSPSAGMVASFSNGQPPIFDFLPGRIEN
jgi:hypothetical protein